MVYRASLEDMRGARPFTAAEERLIAQCRFDGVSIGNGEVPNAPMDDAAPDKVEIRGGLIRHLMLGGCAGFGERGSD